MTARWPTPDEASIRAYYGPPGETQLRTVRLPYQMRLSWALTAAPVDRIRCHRLVADDLCSILAEIKAEVYQGDMAALAAAGLDILGGVYNLRRMRDNPGKWSMHAWGIAIDLDPLRNDLRTPWPSRATMPVQVIEVFERHGWTSLARVIGRDAMHFQATSWPGR